ncbi:MAG: radical SAM protein, partial [Chloroflexota bacterium]
PSMRCNLRCVGCYAGEYSQKDDLSSDLLQKVVREAKELGIVFMVVIGGEPFISSDVLQTWEEDPEISFIVFTNGTLIDEAMAKRLARMENVYPAISVEGFEAETDARRGRGTFARAMKAMDNLRREGLLFGFSATAIRSNNEVISSPEFVDFYVNKGCFMGWYFNYIPIGREPDMSLMPTPEQRIARWRRIREIRKTRPILLADFWCDGILTGGCIAGGKYYMHINNKGDAEPCVFVHFAVDNIKDKTLTEIAQSPFFRAIQDRQPFSPNLLRPCMIIDNPEVLRSLSVEAGAAPTHQGAETVIGKLASRLDEYAREYAKVADEVWKEVV